MFTHKLLVRKEIYRARDTDYELLVFQTEETGDFEITINKCGIEVGDYIGVSKELMDDARTDFTPDFSIEDLLQIARSEIDQNEFGKY